MINQLCDLRQGTETVFKIDFPHMREEGASGEMGVLGPQLV